MYRKDINSCFVVGVAINAAFKRAPILPRSFCVTDFVFSLGFRKSCSTNNLF